MAFSRHARLLRASWRSERRTLRQGLVALTLSTAAGFLAGLTLEHITGRLERLPGLLVLIPAAVGMRGTIFGAMSARLGTASAAGLLTPTLERDGALYRNSYVSVETTFASALCLAVSLLVMAHATVTHVPGVRRIIGGMAAVIVLTPVLDILAGTLLQTRSNDLLTSLAVLLMVPPFVSPAGALGEILSSRVASKLQIGVVRPRGWPEPPALLDAALVAGAGIMMFTLIGAAGSGLAALTDLRHPGIGVMIGGTLLAGVMTLPVMIGVSYELAVLATRTRLGPDDHGVPIITSVMDLVGVTVFLLSMTLLGVGGR